MNTELKDIAESLHNLEEAHYYLTTIQMNVIKAVHDRGLNHPHKYQVEHCLNTAKQLSGAIHDLHYTFYAQLRDVADQLNEDE